MSPPQDSRFRLTPLLIPASLGLVTVLFALVFLRWPNNFYADDSYFYFQVAWNIAHGMGSTFNNLIPTNGYHPLWMLCCVAVFRLVPSKYAAMHAIAGLIVALDVGAMWLVARLLRTLAPGTTWAAYLIFVPFCFLGQLGTEGALSGFFLASLMLAAYRVCIQPVRGAAFLFVLCGALAVLSRLDNIFVVSLNLAAVLLQPASDRDLTGRHVKTLILKSTPVYALLWGTYLASNLVWFGTLQPISGMLKAHPHGEEKHLHLPPHTALLAAALIAICVVILARKRRDLFFQVVEAPFAAGVLIHAIYITFFLSSETRWTWYYTSWVLLASVVFSRVLSLLVGHRRRARVALATLAILLLCAVWWKRSYRAMDHPVPGALGEGYQRNLHDRLRLHALDAFDKPGRMAFFSDVPIVALDGLMGDLAFQKELATNGIGAFNRAKGVDSFSGPAQPLNAAGKDLFCDHIFLSSVRFHCVALGPGVWTVDAVEVFARLSGTSAGILPLPPGRMVWNEQGNIAVWKLPPADPNRRE